MSNKLYFLISFVLALVLAGNASAYDTCVWDNDLGAGNQRWDTATNWDLVGGPSTNYKLPTADDWAAIDDYGGDPCDEPIIDANTNAVCLWLDLGYIQPAISEIALTMTGGTIKGCTWMSTGYYYGGTYRFDLSGGTIDLGIWGFTVGWATDSYNTFNMSGGTFNCEDFLSIGTGNASQSDMNMTGGDVNLTGWFEIGSFDTRVGTGHVDLHGGTVKTALLCMGGGGAGTMDFAGGTLIIDGDYRVPNGWLFDPCNDDPNFGGTYTGTIAILAERGLITAYDTQVGGIITSGTEVGLRAAINLDYDVINPGQTTLTAGAVDPNLAWDPDPLFGAGGLRASDITQVSWAAGDNAALHDVYFGTDFAEVNEASDPNTLPGRGRQALADVNYPASISWDTTYYWRIDEVNGLTTWEGTVWNFVTGPAWATNPSPTGGGVALFPVLTWDPGPEANDVNGHHVYFSTDFNDVNERDPSVMTVISDACFIPGDLEDLEFSKLYHWAVDEVNSNEDPNIWPSLNWSFTTADHLIVDKFNSYATHDEMRAVWRDYWAKPGDTGSELFVETTLARDGNSMRYTYNNLDKYAGQYGSETEAAIANLESESGLDWTFGGIKALVLYFYGDPCNSAGANDQMYVALSDGSNIGLVKYDPCHGYDMNNIKEESWHTWNISLKDPCFIAGAVDMNNVETIYIGFGGARVLGANLQGGPGIVYFDDIELYPPRCRSGLVETDITGDCVTDYKDVDIMARDWLMYDYNVPAVDITVGPVGWWKFDEGSGAIAEDSGTGGNDGDIYETSWVAGYPNDPCDPNYALHFDGAAPLFDRVICAERTGEGNQVGDYPAELMPDTFTIACWVKCDSFDYYETFVTNGDDYGTQGNQARGFYLYGSGTSHFGLAIRTKADKFINYVTTPNGYKIDTWYHLAATYNDANTVSIYVDGKLARGPTDVGGPMEWKYEGVYPEYFVIGGLPVRYTMEWYYADGTIDDVRFYNYALSYGQIVKLAEQGPVLYFELISPANFYNLEGKTFKKVNFRDYVILADHWLEGPILWPN